MTQDTSNLAVLFADVAGSTRLYEVLGDHRARDLIVACVELMRAATERNRGRVIKTIGDEILAIFPTASDAVNAAAEIQQDLGAHPELAVQGQRLAIRIGCHYGPVVLENKDIFGASVHTANRMTSQAKGGQIILSKDAVARLAPEWRASGAADRRHSGPRAQRGSRVVRGALAAGRRHEHAALDRDRSATGPPVETGAPELPGARVRPRVPPVPALGL